MSKADDKWQKAAFKSKQVMTEHGLTLSAKKKYDVI
jgi:hypothetical protein